MKQIVLARIAEILADFDLMIEGANVCDKAYAESVGHPEWHVPFGKEEPEKVAQNVAGIQAVVSTLGALHMERGCYPVQNPEATLRILNEMAEGTISAVEKDIAMRFANCAWGAGQPFRTDKGPLGRMNRMNVFDLLPVEEQEKDMVQIRAVANWLLSKM